MSALDRHGEVALRLAGSDANEHLLEISGSTTACIASVGVAGGARLSHVLPRAVVMSDVLMQDRMERATANAVRAKDPTAMPTPKKGLVEETVLGSWAARRPSPTVSAAAPHGTRFAFYGRVSTEDHQDPETSRGWQLLNAQALTSGHGRIVVEFFDVGHSRSLPWARRPDAAALVTALADPDRGFDAIVIGSSERAFNGQQFAAMAPLFAHYGVPVWLPELGGEVDPEIVAHDVLAAAFPCFPHRSTPMDSGVNGSLPSSLTPAAIKVNPQSGKFLHA
ncbi:hypothetical protein ACPA54_03345 [Uniformispora flossi]|uniref:hypothetical protein n=1 Tax=Uniformispora flossi TaxID=3390723 RepID=UPI003C2C1ABB